MSPTQVLDGYVEPTFTARSTYGGGAVLLCLHFQPVEVTA